MDLEATFVIVGGGIAGVSCVETLSYLCPDEKIILITATSVVKAVRNISHLTKLLATFDIEECSGDELENKHKHLTVLRAEVTNIDADQHKVFVSDKGQVKYKYLALCHGARPKVIDQDGSPHVLAIRDTESVVEFQKRLEGAKKIVIVGNGGIATEMVYELENIDIVWAIKDDSIAATFVDVGAGQFFLDQMNKEKQGSNVMPPAKRTKYTAQQISDEKGKKVGAALGPDWHSGLNVSGCFSSGKQIHVEYKCEVKKVWSKKDLESAPQNEDFPVFVELNNGKMFGCDFVVSATGVVPNGALITLKSGQFELNQRALVVNDNMETSIEDIFAAGDVCDCSAWKHSKHWFQMRLWTQARLMGMYLAQCLDAKCKGSTKELDFSFELFSHVTKFFGYKVILLGLFNGQGMDNDYEVLLRVTKGLEYVKTVMKDGKMQGAILIGETDLEETFENLILNQMDLSAYGADLLDPNIDIEDYFD